MLQDNLEPEHPIGSMEKINANLLAKIRAAAFPDELSAVAVRLSVAKNVFIVSASLYFSFYLFAVGGFEPSITGPIAYLTYPAFLLATYAFAYELVNYGVKVYAENMGFLRYIALGICGSMFVFGTVVHFWPS